MFRYSCFGLAVHSEVEIPELPPGPELSPGNAKPDVVIRLGSVPPTKPRATLDEEIVFHDRAGAFHIKQGREIILDPAPGAEPALLRVLLAGRMMAYLLRQRGRLPLHASGIELDGQAVLFLGARGSGKSTTAAAFHARGHQVVTDDVGAVRVDDAGQCLLRPAGPRVRLLEDSRAAFDGAEPEGVSHWRKRLFDLTRGVQRGEQPELIQVCRIYALDYGDDIGTERIPPVPAVAALSAHSFIEHGRMNKAALQAHLRDCSSVAAAVPVYRLFRPRSLAALPDLVRWVEIDVADSTGSIGKAHCS
jgi:hypothetical protein